MLSNQRAFITKYLLSNKNQYQTPLSNNYIYAIRGLWILQLSNHPVGSVMPISIFSWQVQCLRHSSLKENPEIRIQVQRVYWKVILGNHGREEGKWSWERKELNICCVIKKASGQMGLGKLRSWCKTSPKFYMKCKGAKVFIHRCQRIFGWGTLLGVLVSQHFQLALCWGTEVICSFRKNIQVKNTGLW